VDLAAAIANASKSVTTTLISDDEGYIVVVSLESSLTTVVRGARRS